MSAIEPAYNDDDVRVAQAAYYAWRDGKGTSRTGLESVLDAVAPAIAARALREAASAYWERSDVPDKFEPWRWLRDRADELEAP